MSSAPDVADLAERLLRSMLGADPLEATLIGYREYDASLADLAPEAVQRRIAEREGIRAQASMLDPTHLAPQDALTLAVVLAQLGYLDELDAVESGTFTVASFPVAPASVLLAYLRMIVLTDGEQAQAYAQRLSEIPRYLRQAATDLHRGRAAGRTPVARLVQAAIAQIEAFTALSPSPFLLSAPASWDGRQDWTARVERIIAEDVVPSFTVFAEELRASALPTARDDDHPGLMHIPGGSERYELLVRVHTTTDTSAEEYHALGLGLLQGIHEEFSALGSEVFGESDVPAIFARLQDDPALRWSHSEEILIAAEETVRRAEAASASWFGRLPRAVCAVERIPELEADGAAPAYYMPPSLDGSRPGTYFANVNSPEQRTSFDLESVAFHEAVPGHHFQISLALELEGLPTLRRLSMFNAYAEGWGLYAERLADEMGLYSSPLQRIGMLSADAWRAARLVVDTGLHAHGWTRDRAVRFMRDNTPVAPIDVESEVDRYIAFPGQALSYMAGRLEIQRLRRRAEEVLGARFDIATFHDIVLGSGALPLSVLAESVERWLAEQPS